MRLLSAAEAKNRLYAGVTKAIGFVNRSTGECTVAFHLVGGIVNSTWRDPCRDPDTRPDKGLDSHYQPSQLEKYIMLEAIREDRKPYLPTSC